jgi:hypothetical protein
VHLRHQEAGWGTRCGCPLRHFPNDQQSGQAQPELQAEDGVHAEEGEDGGAQVGVHGAQAGLVGEEQRQHGLQAQQPQAPQPRRHVRAARAAPLSLR